MAIPVEITFHGIPGSEWIENEIRRRVDRLAESSRIIGCRVVVDRPHRHHQQGNRFRVRIDVILPGAEIAVSHESNLFAAGKDAAASASAKRFEVEAMRKDLRLVICDAFDVARRRVRGFNERRREIRVTSTTRRRPARATAA